MQEEGKEGDIGAITPPISPLGWTNFRNSSIFSVYAERNGNLRRINYRTNFISFLVTSENHSPEIFIGNILYMRFHNKRDNTPSCFEYFSISGSVYSEMSCTTCYLVKISVSNSFYARYYKQFKLHRYAAGRFIELMDSQFMAHRLTDISEQTA